MMMIVRVSVAVWIPECFSSRSLPFLKLHHSGEPTLGRRSPAAVSLRRPLVSLAGHVATQLQLWWDWRAWCCCSCSDERWPHRGPLQVARSLCPRLANPPYHHHHELQVASKAVFEAHGHALYVDSWGLAAMELSDESPLLGRRRL